MHARSQNVSTMTNALNVLVCGNIDFPIVVDQPNRDVGLRKHQIQLSPEEEELLLSIES